jgi:hypothetical protein
LYSHGSTACAKLKVGHFVGYNMYKTPSNFQIGMRGGAPDLWSPLKILFTDRRLIPLGIVSVIMVPVIKPHHTGLSAVGELPV